MAGESLETVEQAIKGENPVAFRVKAQELDQHENAPSVRRDGPIERTSVELAELAPTFMQHQAITGVPFVASYYKMEGAFKALDQSQQEAVESIESYIKSQIESGKLSDSVEGVAALIKELEGKINLKEYHDPLYRSEKLAAYLGNLQAYNKHQTVKARVAKEAAAKEQVETVKRVEEKLEAMKPDAAKLERKISKLSESQRELMQESSSRIEEKIDRLGREQSRLAKEALAKEPDFSGVEEKVARLERAVMPLAVRLSEKVDSLLNLTASAEENARLAADRAERVVAENKNLKSKRIETKDALARLLQGI